MTIGEIIERIDEVRPNSQDRATKVRWISNLDWNVMIELIETHEQDEEVTYTGYSDSVEDSQELLVPEPYSTMYQYWLEAQIDYTNGEIDRYNVSMVKFNEAWDHYATYYNRHHMPITKASWKI